MDEQKLKLSERVAKLDPDLGREVARLESDLKQEITDREDNWFAARRMHRKMSALKAENQKLRIAAAVLESYLRPPSDAASEIFGFSEGEAEADVQPDEPPSPD